MDLGRAHGGRQALGAPRLPLGSLLGSGLSILLLNSISPNAWSTWPAFSLAGHAPDAPCPDSLGSLVLSVREGEGGPFFLPRPAGSVRGRPVSRCREEYAFGLCSGRQRQERAG